MTQFEFTGSIRFATGFVVGNLLHPIENSVFERPLWAELGWFDAITATDFWDTPRSPSANADIDYFSEMGRLVQRTVSFGYGDYAVAHVTVRGIRSNKLYHPVWAVRHVEYQLDMPLPPKQARWASQDMPALSLSSAPTRR